MDLDSHPVDRKSMDLNQRNHLDNKTDLYVKEGPHKYQSNQAWDLLGILVEGRE